MRKRSHRVTLTLLGSAALSAGCSNVFVPPPVADGPEAVPAVAQKQDELPPAPDESWEIVTAEEPPIPPENATLSGIDPLVNTPPDPNATAANPATQNSTTHQHSHYHRSYGYGWSPFHTMFLPFPVRTGVSPYAQQRPNVFPTRPHYVPPVPGFSQGQRSTGTKSSGWSWFGGTSRSNSSSHTSTSHSSSSRSTTTHSSPSHSSSSSHTSTSRGGFGHSSHSVSGHS